MHDLSVKNNRDDDITEDDLTPLVIMDGKHFQSLKPEKLRMFKTPSPSVHDIYHTPPVFHYHMIFRTTLWLYFYPA